MVFRLQIVGAVPELVSCLRKQDAKASSIMLESLVELIDCLMFQHPGFPDLYEPVVDALKVSKPLLYCLGQGGYVLAILRTVVLN